MERLRRRPSGAEDDWESTNSETTADGGDTEQEDDAADAAISVTEAAIVSESVAFSEYAVVEATLENTGEGDGTFVAGVAVSPDVVDTRPVSVAAGESKEISFAIRATNNGTVTVNGSIAGEQLPATTIVLCYLFTIPYHSRRIEQRSRSKQRYQSASVRAMTCHSGWDSQPSLGEHPFFPENRISV